MAGHDEVVVEELLAGRLSPAAARDVDRAEALRRMVAAGASATSIARRLRMSGRSAAAAVARLGGARG